SRVSATTAGVVAEKYQAAGAMLEWLINENWQVSPGIMMSNARYHGQQQGNKAELQSNIMLPAQLSLSLSASHYTGGYREMTEAMDPDSQSYQNSWNASLNWNNDIMGSVSVQYSADSGD